MIVDRYYYQQLNKQEQMIYKAFYNGVMAHQDIIPIPVRGKFSQNIFQRIFSAVTKDNPLIYYLNQSACSCASDLFGNLAICPQYFFSKEKVKAYNRKIEKEVNHLAGILKLTEGSDYEKELKIHDWFCRNITYDAEGADLNKVSRVILSHNILGVFAHHCAQCEGIAKAVKVMLNSVDVKCMVVTGDASISGRTVAHAWNIVNIEGQPYHLDVTWDIGAVVPFRQKIPYDYFNLSDKMITCNHQVDFHLPKCVALKYNYFILNNMVFRLKNRALMYVEKELRSGQSEFYFRIEGRLKASDIADEVHQMIVSVLNKQGIGVKGVRQITNDELGTCWMKVY